MKKKTKTNSHEPKLTRREQAWLDKFKNAEAVNPIEQGKAWMVVYELCVRLGMYDERCNITKPAIVKICEFIYKNATKPKKVK